MQIAVKFTVCLGLMIMLSSLPLGAGTDDVETAAEIDHRYHYTFDEWATSVVRLRISTEPGSDITVQEDMSVQRCPPVEGLSDGVFAHFKATIRNATAFGYRFLQSSVSDGPILLVQHDNTTLQSPGVPSDGSACWGGIFAYLYNWLWRGGMYELYYSTQGGDGELFLNISGTDGLISHEVDVLDGARFLRSVDFDGVAAHANLLMTNVGASLMQSATVATSGPTMGHSSFERFSKASCTAPDGRNCHNRALMAEEPGAWDFAIDHSIRPDSPMWYVGAVFPR